MDILKHGDAVLVLDRYKNTEGKWVKGRRRNSETIDMVMYRTRNGVVNLRNTEETYNNNEVEFKGTINKGFYYPKKKKITRVTRIHTITNSVKGFIDDYRFIIYFCLYIVIILFAWINLVSKN